MAFGVGGHLDPGAKTTTAGLPSEQLEDEGGKSRRGKYISVRGGEI